MDFRTADQQRVVDTATYFARGYMSQGGYLNNTNMNRIAVVSLVDSATNSTWADSLTPSSCCPAYANYSGNGGTFSTMFRNTYLNKTADRLNVFLDGLVLNSSDISVAMDLCGFGWEVNSGKQWCSVFLRKYTTLLSEEGSKLSVYVADEWMNYEYAHDLNYYYGSGPGNPIAATTGYPWVKAVSDLFVSGPGASVANGNFTPPPLIMTFTVSLTAYCFCRLKDLTTSMTQHDNNIPPIIAALGLWNSSVSSPNEPETIYPLSITQRTDDPSRHFHATYSVMFLGSVALERMTCVVGGSTLAQEQHAGIVHQAGFFGGKVNMTFATPPTTATFVRARISEAPVLIPGCTSGPGSSCPLNQFTEMVDGPLANAAGDFVQVCGLQDNPKAESTMKFLTTAGDGKMMVVGIEGTPKGPAVPDNM